jgi:hypothetical protein
MRTVHDIASACGGGSEFALGEHRPEVGGGGPV